MKHAWRFIKSYLSGLVTLLLILYFTSRSVGFKIQITWNWFTILMTFNYLTTFVFARRACTPLYAKIHRRSNQKLALDLHMKDKLAQKGGGDWQAPSTIYHHDDRSAVIAEASEVSPLLTILKDQVVNLFVMLGAPLILILKKLALN